MAYPYIPSGGILLAAVNQFKKALPAKVDTETLKKLGIAPSNEGYVISTMKFLGVVGDDNARTEEGHKLFTTHGDDAFAKELEKVVREKYAALFDLRGDESWQLDRDALISFFRASDKSTEIVGARQANTFMTLASLAGKREGLKTRVTKGKPTATPKPSPKPKAYTSPASSPAAKAANGGESPAAHLINGNGNVGLTVRIEINLPANGSQATYDNIFKSIRDNLLKQNA